MLYREGAGKISAAAKQMVLPNITLQCNEYIIDRRAISESFS
jgi:hypothetical protein